MTTRKKTLQSIAQNEKRDQSEKSENIFSNKAHGRLIEKDIKQTEDNLKHLQKTSQKDDEQQHELYKNVKDSEFMRRKKEKDVKKLHEVFLTKQKENSAMIKQVLAKVFEEEQNMQQDLAREKAKLDKVWFFFRLIYSIKNLTLNIFIISSIIRNVKKHI